jgi:hypothetical protein
LFGTYDVGVDTRLLEVTPAALVELLVLGVPVAKTLPVNAPLSWAAAAAVERNTLICRLNSPLRIVAAPVAFLWCTTRNLATPSAPTQLTPAFVVDKWCTVKVTPSAVDPAANNVGAEGSLVILIYDDTVIVVRKSHPIRTLVIVPPLPIMLEALRLTSAR